MCYKIGSEDYEQFVTRDIKTGEQLHANTGAVKLLSVNGYELWFQTTGNLEMKYIDYVKGASVIWSSNTAGHPNAMLAFQGDGNVVIYDGGNPIWATQTADNQKSGKGGVKLLLNGAGNVKVLNVDSQYDLAGALRLFFIDRIYRINRIVIYTQDQAGWLA